MPTPKVSSGALYQMYASHELVIVVEEGGRAWEELECDVRAFEPWSPCRVTNRGEVRYDHSDLGAPFLLLRADSIEAPQT